MRSTSSETKSNLVTVSKHLFDNAPKISCMIKKFPQNFTCTEHESFYPFLPLLLLLLLLFILALLIVE